MNGRNLGENVDSSGRTSGDFAGGRCSMTAQFLYSQGCFFRSKSQEGEFAVFLQLVSALGLLEDSQKAGELCVGGCV